MANRGNNSKANGCNCPETLAPRRLLPNSAPHKPCNAAVSAASSRGVPPREGTRGGTPRELAGGDACATTAASVQGFNARNFFSGNSFQDLRRHHCVLTGPTSDALRG